MGVLSRLSNCFESWFGESDWFQVPSPSMVVVLGTGITLESFHCVGQSNERTVLFDVTSERLKMVATGSASSGTNSLRMRYLINSGVTPTI